MPASSLAALLRRVLAAPALHFAVAGAALFAVSQLVDGGGADEPPDRVIVVDAPRIAGLRRDYRLSSHREAGEAETRALVDKLVREEILFREGLARGFELGDRSIAWRLVQKMRFLGEDDGSGDGELYRRALAMGLHRSDPIVRNILVEKMRLLIGRAAPAPTEAELVAFYDAHRADYAQGGRATLRQVFFDKSRRGDDAARRDAEEAAVAAAGHGADAAKILGGDPFILGGEMRAQGRADLAKYFGPAFADEVLALPEGRWSAPVRSSYGWHLVFVESKLDSRIPALSEVRSRVEKGYETAARELRVEAFLAEQRARYEVRIDEEAIRG